MRPNENGQKTRKKIKETEKKRKERRGSIARFCLTACCKDEQSGAGVEPDSEEDEEDAEVDANTLSNNDSTSCV